MKDFIIKNLVAEDIEAELAKVGFDVAYRSKAAYKYKYKTLKIFDLTLPQANILKQTALSLGADCALHREVLTSMVEKTDVILGGSYSQIRKISEKLKKQPFSLPKLAEQILIQLQDRDSKTKIVGILNLTPDSFSDGGKYFQPKKAIKHVYQLIDDGADMIDIGAESTKPGAKAIPPEKQISRIYSVLKEIKTFPIPFSVDTRSAEVARFALDNGATMINDVSGLDYDPVMKDVIAQYNCPVIIQHSKGLPEDMQNNPKYSDVVEEVYKSLLYKTQLAESKGIKNIILDVGIGFGKTKEHNFELLNRIEEFYSLGYPLMVGVSRKSFLGVQNNDNNLKDILTLAVSYPLIKKGVDYLRVHNVKLHKQLITSAI